jgi:ergothioneine biosynthesis protein EgtB
MIENYLKVRKETEKIVEPLEIEDFVVQPIKDVSPPKWHLGHTTWFFETFILKEFKENYEFYNLKFQEIFNSYYKSVGPHWAQVNRGNLSRPTVQEIFNFRHQIDETLIEFLKVTDNPKIQKVLTVGLEHEKQHQELLLMDIKYILGANSMEIAYSKKSLLAELPQSEMEFLFFEGGLSGVGAGSEDFSFDNEKPKHQVHIAPFKMANRPVTNGEYLNFINDNGYQNPAFWLSDGWDQKVKNLWSAPLYWKKIDDEWFEFTLTGTEKLNLNKPVTHISFYEADAFSLWAGKRLPTEFEWECSTISNSSLWEWTSSAYLPYPGYRREKGPFGEYNGKFMCGQKVLKGGSFASPKNHVRKSYRNFYHPDKRWQFSGLRLADNI